MQTANELFNNSVTVRNAIINADVTQAEKNKYFALSIDFKIMCMNISKILSKFLN
jgi:hypothetical protein